MKLRTLIASVFAAACLWGAPAADAQFNVGRIAKAAGKAAQAVTLSDAQMTAYVKEYIDWMDTHNPVLPADDPYTKRLDSLTAGLTSVEGIPLNFKVYNVIDVNAFACADGSVRVFAALMDIMDDDELLGVIGHEVGHVAHKDSKKAFKQALLTSALADGVASTSSTAAALTDSQLGSLGQALAGATYSKKQEKRSRRLWLPVPEIARQESPRNGQIIQKTQGAAGQCQGQQAQPALLVAPRPRRPHQENGTAGRQGRIHRINNLRRRALIA